MTANLPQSPAKPETSMGTRVRNLLIVMVAIALTVSLFLGMRTQTDTATLTELAENSTPLEVAMSNGKPTLMEFYANWCTTCQAMAKDMGELEQEYAEQVNFVMLNVDNDKWLPEITRYRVDGIPHFVFFGKDGTEIAQTIGEQPRTIMAANLAALVAGEELPHAKTTGQTSKFEAPVSAKKSASEDPRSHGAQVVN
ncbi:thioredoxin family protein [Microseira sp. BLCC-F43]|jgi:thiol-disulfide isomerase/thioredoxin|uniref:thioredoxin family protein n=1 Tax=Microseira sp. BLCC-F43 TaxID=3153602 RepID=UPI0035BB68AA